MNKFLLFCLVLVFNPLSSLAQFEICNSNTQVHLWDVYFLDENTGFAVGDSGLILRSIDAGLNWSEVMQNDTVVFRKVGFFDSEYGIAIGSDIYRTTNSGQTWEPLPLENQTWFDIALLDSSTCLISGYPLGMVKSSNKGQSWEVIEPDNPNQELGLMDFIDANHGFMCPYGGQLTTRLFVTTDAGMHWDTLMLSTGIENTIIEALEFLPDGSGFRAGWYNGHLGQSQDGGQNWSFSTFVDSNYWGQLYDLHVAPGAFYSCGWYGDILKSEDGGHNWFKLPSPINNTTSLYGIFFIDPLHGWIVGAEGTILRTTNGGGVVNTIHPNVAPDVSVYPNPGTGDFKLDYASSLDVYSFSVLSLDGKIIRCSKSFTDLKLQNLPVGTYVVQIFSNQGIIYRQIIKQ